MANIRTIPLEGRCVTRMIPDPIGGGMLAGFHIGSAVGIARIDREGSWVHEKMPPRVLPPEAKDVLQVATILTSSTTIVLFEQINADVTEGITFVHVLDLETLEPTLPVRAYPGSVVAAEWIDGERFVLLRRGTEAFSIGTVRGDPEPGRDSCCLRPDRSRWRGWTRCGCSSATPGSRSCWCWPISRVPSPRRSPACRGSTSARRPRPRSG